MDDALTATLAEIRERVASCMDGFSSDPGAYIRSAGDVPRLLAAVDAVLKLADDLTGDAAPSSAYEEDRAWLRAEIAARFRSAVLAVLTGKGET